MKSFYFTANASASGRIGPAACKVPLGKICAINKKLLLWWLVSISPIEHETDGNSETFPQVSWKSSSPTSQCFPYIINGIIYRQYAWKNNFCNIYDICMIHQCISCYTFLSLGHNTLEAQTLKYTTRVDDTLIIKYVIKHVYMYSIKESQYNNQTKIGTIQTAIGHMHFYESNY